jgi:hypothetical protein
MSEQELPKIQTWFNKALNLPVNKVTSNIGSILDIDCGQVREIKGKRWGEVGIFITGDHWELYKLNKLIASSIDERAVFLQHIEMLVGLKIENILIDIDNCYHEINFSDDVSIKTVISKTIRKKEAEDAPLSDWDLIFPGRSAIGFGPGLYYSVEYYSTESK